MNRNHVVLTALSAFVVLTSAACGTSVGSGNIVTQTYSFEDFDRVEIGSSFDAEVSVGDEFRVEVRVDDNLVSDLEISVDGGELEIRMADGSYLNSTQQAVVTVPELRAVRVGGASDVRVDGVEGAEFDLDVGGSSNVTVEASADRLIAKAEGSSDLEVSGSYDRIDLAVGGSSDVTFAGSTTVLDLDVGGASDVRLDRLSVGDASVDVGGSSDVELRDAERVNGELSGSSDLRVAATAEVNVSTSGSSSVHRG